MSATELGLDELPGSVIEFAMDLIGSCTPALGHVMSEIAAITEAGVVAFDFSGDG